MQVDAVGADDHLLESSARTWVSAATRRSRTRRVFRRLPPRSPAGWARRSGGSAPAFQSFVRIAFVQRGELHLGRRHPAAQQGGVAASIGLVVDNHQQLAQATRVYRSRRRVSAKPVRKPGSDSISVQLGAILGRERPQDGALWLVVSRWLRWPWSSSSAIWLRPHRSGQAAFPHPALPGSNPHHAARGVQGWVIRGLGRGKPFVTVSNQSQPIRRFFWLRRLRQLNQMRRASCRNPFRERQLCGRPK